MLTRAEAKPAPVAADSQLEEQRHGLVGRRNALKDELKRCVDAALVDAAAASRRDQLNAELAEVDVELKQVNVAMDKRDARSGPDTTELWYRSAGSQLGSLYWGPVDTRGPIP